MRSDEAEDVGGRPGGPGTEMLLRFARAGLNTPQEQKRVSVAAACSGVRRFSFTKSIIFFASE